MYVPHLMATLNGRESQRIVNVFAHFCAKFHGIQQVLKCFSLKQSGGCLTGGRHSAKRPSKFI